MKQIGICGICHKRKKVERRAVYIPELNRIALSKDPFCDDCFTPELRAKMDKRMGRPKGSKNKPKVQVSVPPVDAPKDIVSGVVKTIPDTEPAPELQAFELYRTLRDAGFPQGGVGNWLYNEFGTDKVYVPHASEVYNQFVADPDGWEKMTEAMARVWLWMRNLQS